MAYIANPSASRARASRAGRAMGDTAAPLVLGPAGKLLAQINRFTARGQYGGKVYTAQELASGNLPAAAAYTAAIIYQTRLLVAQTGIVDTGTAAQLAAVNAAMASGKTAAWVMANLGIVTDTIRGYADSLGLPNPIDGAASTTIPPVVVIAAIGVAAYLLFGKGGK